MGTTVRMPFLSTCLFVLLASCLSSISCRELPTQELKWWKEGQDGTGGSPETCMILHCGLEMTACYFEQECFDTLQCMQECKDRPDMNPCWFECQMTLGILSEKFSAFVQCIGEHGCFPEIPPDGDCLAGPEDTVQDITSLDQVAGDWWVVRGVNCGQDTHWSGAYDWLPCQHARYIQLEDDYWVNNTTYCGGRDSVCTTKQFVTAPKATLVSPGVIRIDYDDTPLLPQVENWHLVSMPDPNFMLVMWCGTNPALDYNGGFLLSRGRTQDGLTPESEATLRAVSERLGVSWDSMCITDNTQCPQEP